MKTRKLTWYFNDPMPYFEDDTTKHTTRICETAVVVKREIGKKWIYHGECKEWRGNGQLYSTCNYKNHKRHGRWDYVSIVRGHNDISFFKNGIAFGQSKYGTLLS